MPGGFNFLLQSGFQQSFSGRAGATLLGAFVQPFGIGLILPPHPNGQQIDAINAAVDSDGNDIEFGCRVMAVIGSPQGLQLAVSNLFASPGEVVGSSVPFVGYVHRWPSDVLFPNNPLIADVNTTGQRPSPAGGFLNLVFSSRPGAGLLIPPGMGGIVLVARNVDNDTTGSFSQVMHFLSVSGGPLAPGQFEQASNAALADMVGALARFGNVIIAPALST